jgi:hypothetical protein
VCADSRTVKGSAEGEQLMSLAVVDERPKKRRDHSLQLKELSDEAVRIVSLHAEGKIDGDEAARRLDELKARHRTFLDRLVG